jgi:Protein kinase domain
VSDASDRPEPALPSLKAGSVFAGYRIVGVLDRGGMGVVYKAVDVDLDRTVALKIIAPEHTQDPTAVARFKAEARLAASLEHPNIVPVHRGGEENGVLYLAMRFVPGTNLRHIIDRGPMALPRVARITTDIADALDAAHALGLVHRDVKPANILVSGPPEHEHVYLSDFGLTKRLGSVGALTRTGSWVGTPDYVAPEQIQGHTVDCRADIYSLGCVLYEMLTGHVAYPKDTDVAKLWAHVADPPPMPSTERPELGASFDDTIARATAKDPAERYPTAGDLAAAVRRAVAEQEAKRQHEAAQPTQLAADEPPSVLGAAAPAEPAPAASGGGGPLPAASGGGGPLPAASGGGGPPPAAWGRGGPLRRHRVPAIAGLALVCAAAVVAAILLSTSSDSPSSTTAASSASAGERATSDLAPVPYSKVQGTGEAVVQLEGDVATVSVKANGLLNAPHAMHFHAGTRGECPPPRAARDHGGHLAISTSNGVPWYGPPVTALTMSGDTSPKKSLLAFTRFPSGGRIDYHRRFPLRPVVASYIRHKNAVVIVHGIDYNRNGIYDLSALDRSELKRSLPAETTAPALCGALVPTGNKTGQVGGGPKVYTASLHLVDASAPESQDGTPRWLCPLVTATGDQRPRA